MNEHSNLNPTDHPPIPRDVPRQDPFIDLRHVGPPTVSSQGHEDVPGQHPAVWGRAQRQEVTEVSSRPDSVAALGNMNLSASGTPDPRESERSEHKQTGKEEVSAATQQTVFSAEQTLTETTPGVTPHVTAESGTQPQNDDANDSPTPAQAVALVDESGDRQPTESLQREIAKYLQRAESTEDMLPEGTVVEIPTVSGPVTYTQPPEEEGMMTTGQPAGAYMANLFPDRLDEAGPKAGGEEGAFGGRRTVLDIASGRTIALHELSAQYPESTFIGVDPNYGPTAEVNPDTPGVQLTQDDWHTLDTIPSGSVNTIISTLGIGVHALRSDAPESSEQIAEAVTRVAREGAVLRIDAVGPEFIKGLLEPRGWDVLSIPDLRDGPDDGLPDELSAATIIAVKRSPGSHIPDDPAKNTGNTVHEPDSVHRAEGGEAARHEVAEDQQDLGSLADRLKRLVRESGLTQASLAEANDWSLHKTHRILNGVSHPNRQDIEAIARVIDATPEQEQELVDQWRTERTARASGSSTVSDAAPEAAEPPPGETGATTNVPDQTKRQLPEISFEGDDAQRPMVERLQQQLANDPQALKRAVKSLRDDWIEHASLQTPQNTSEEDRPVYKVIAEVLEKGIDRYLTYDPDTEQAIDSDPRIQELVRAHRATDDPDRQAKITRQIRLSHLETYIDRANPSPPTESPEEPTALGPWLDELRRGASLTIEKLADEAGLSTGGLHNILRGKGTPFPENVTRLMEALREYGAPISDEIMTERRVAAVAAWYEMIHARSAQTSATMRSR